jgi:hypothetical protein
LDPAVAFSEAGAGAVTLAVGGPDCIEEGGEPTRYVAVASRAAWKGDSNGPEVAPLPAGPDLREAHADLAA